MGNRWLRAMLAPLIILALVGCGPTAGHLDTIEYRPLTDLDDWPISTPEEQGLEPRSVARLFYAAGDLDTLYGLVVVKNGNLVAEGYFGGSSVDDATLMASASKSYVSTLVGIALEKGCITSLDQTLLEFFPEYADQIQDPRKREITLRHLLQMRSGYPWEEIDAKLFEAMWVGDNPPMIVHFPLTADPGTEFQYSNLTAAWLADIVTRACGGDLRTVSEDWLLDPIGSGNGEMWPDTYDDFHALYHLTARDAARYGQLYLDGGVWRGEQIVPADWVRDSLTVYSKDAWKIRVGRNWHKIGYGYQWWAAELGEHPVRLAWGHGGQLIVLVHDMDMVVVTKADPFFQEHSDRSWRHEKATLNLVADWVASLPAD